MSEKYFIRTLAKENIITTGVEFNSFIKKAREDQSLTENEKALINTLFNEIQFKKKDDAKFSHNLKKSFKSEAISFGGQQTDYGFEIVNLENRSSVYVSIGVSEFGVFMGYPVGNEKKITPEIISIAFNTIAQAVNSPEIFDKMILFDKINSEVIDKNTHNKKIKI